MTVDPLTTVQTWVLVLAVGIPWVIGATFMVLGTIHGIDVAAEWLRRRVESRRVEQFLARSAVETFDGGSVSWRRERT